MRNIHNLEELAKDAAEHEKRFLDYLDDALCLTRYYIETRYPPLMPINYMREEAKKALDTAKDICNFIKNLL